MSSFKKSLLALALPVALSLSLIACDKSNNTAQEAEVATATTPDKQTSDLPTYTVAMNLDYMPFEYIGEDGEITGFDVDLLKVVAEKAGFDVRLEPYSFDQIIESVKNGKEDMSASSIFIAEDRKKEVDFSEPYFTMPMYLVGVEKAGRPQSVEDITNQKIVIDDHFLLKKIMKDTFIPKGNQAIEVEGNFLAYQKMYNGEADLMLENIMSIEDHHKLDDSKKLFYIPLPKEYSIQLGYITQKGNQELMDKLNEGLQLAKADGSYDEVYNKWFGQIDKMVQDNQNTK